MITAEISIRIRSEIAGEREQRERCQQTQKDFAAEKLHPWETDKRRARIVNRW